MDIFVQEGGKRLGPFTITQLRDALAAADFSGESKAWFEGDHVSSTVDKLLAKAAPPPGTPPPPPEIPEQQPRRRLLQSHSPLPATQPETSGPREQSSKLRRQSGLDPIAQGVIGAKFRPGRRARVIEIPEPTTAERLRFVGAATPLLTAFILLIPWISGTWIPGDMNLSGYQTFEYLTRVKGFLYVFILAFAIGTLGIGWFSFKGGLDGGSAMPGATGTCAAVAVFALFIVNRNLPEATRTVIHCGGASFTFGTLLLGTAFGVIPGRDHTPTSSAITWVIASVLGVAGLILFVVGASIGSSG